MQKIISWYMEHKTYGNILIIGIIGLMLYNIGYGVGTATVSYTHLRAHET